MYTRLGFEGYGVRRAGSFAGKALQQVTPELRVNMRFLQFSTRSHAIDARPRRFLRAGSRRFEVQGKP